MIFELKRIDLKNRKLPAYTLQRLNDWNETTTREKIVESESLPSQRVTKLQTELFISYTVSKS